MSIFRTRSTTHATPESPALLFRDLRRTTDIKFLWDHQGKILDEYHQNQLNTPHVALELPTGAGKTLVGLLIAEFKRQSGESKSCVSVSHAPVVPSGSSTGSCIWYRLFSAGGTAA
jgi:superfamily II DNA or RNA helicase